MDPVTAIGLVSGIMGIIDISVKVAKGAREILDTGGLEVNEERRKAVEAINALRKLTPGDSVRLSGLTAEQDKALCDLSEDCQKLGTKLNEILGNIEPKNRLGKTLGAVGASVKYRMQKSDIKELEERFEKKWVLVKAHIDRLSTENAKLKLKSLVETSQVHSEKLQALCQGVAVASFSPDAENHLRRLLCVGDDVLDQIVQHRILQDLKFEKMYGRYTQVEPPYGTTFEWAFRSHDDDANSELSVDQDNDLEGGKPQAESEEAYSVDNEERDQSESHGSDVDVKDSQSGYDSDDSGDYQALRKRFGDSSEDVTFTNWLRRGEHEPGQEIFHISGKMGSGKSTLMKKLSSDPRTKAALIEWTGGPKPVVASFFFWAPATSELQKSFVGMQRALLHDVLKQRPDLMPELLPDLWKTVRSRPWQIQQIDRDDQMSKEQVTIAFERLVTSGSQSARATSCHLCFFIDGLDEFEASRSYDASDMIQALKGWAKGLPDRVKICVSSREEAQYMAAFSPATRLRLHTLTAPDITIYVKERLNDVLIRLTEEERAKIVHSIVEKGQGVFLWVALAVTAVRERATAVQHAGAADLITEVDDLKSDMTRLFEQIIESVAKSGRNLRRLYQVASIKLAEGEDNLYPGFTLFGFSCLGAYAKSPTFATDTAFMQNRDYWFQCLEPELYTMERTAHPPAAENNRDDFRHCSRGLFEFDDRWDIEYAHRSVADFFRRPDIRRRVSEEIEKFDSLQFASQVCVAALKLVGPDENNRGNRKYGDRLLRVIGLRGMKGYDKPPFDFLQAVEQQKLLPDVLGKEPFHHSNLINILSPGLRPILFSGPLALTELENHPFYSGELYEIRRNPPLLLSLTASGLYDYPIWRLSQDKTKLGPHYAALTASVDILGRLKMSGEPIKPHLGGPSVLRHVIENGLLLPNDPLAESYSSLLMEQYFRLEPRTDSAAVSFSLTLWQSVLFLLAMRLLEGPPVNPATSIFLRIFAKAPSRPDLRFFMTFRGSPRAIGEYLGSSSPTSQDETQWAVQELSVLVGEHSVELGILVSTDFWEEQEASSGFPPAWIAWPPLSAQDIIARSVPEDERDEILTLFGL